ncbi:microtubule-associated protein Jupiter isoform X3 [Aricia agestis]|uniref:microtubule-associated protein Jupiter isoform X3 n=1 Tax=Aricia agestis TaxID=91739 RepID=UPI001C202CE1|nr:microtubule-associated protein Jupiter isoform X3 [Aricia agestis]
MSSTLSFVGLPEHGKRSVTRMSAGGSESQLVRTVDLENSSVTRTENSETGVPNAPKSSIGEIFNGDVPDGGAGSPVKNGSSRPRVPRDTPTRPRDTHSRLFGQVRAANGGSPVAPMITDTIRSNIQFGEHNGSGPHSPKSVASTPSRVLYTPPKRNPVTGDGVELPPPRRRHPAACREGNPITGDGYKSMNGQINMVTSINGNSSILHNKVPPGGYSSGLW